MGINGNAASGIDDQRIISFSFATCRYRASGVAAAFDFAWCRVVCAAGFNAGRISDAALNNCDYRFIYIFGPAFDPPDDSLVWQTAFN